ncbi:hypothetical protein BOX15_Mlig004979g2 [Macrostomum lignano]|uniref:Baculoviral IAP repeat-containing protein 5.1 n=2 Tax=Macrostomum lignano TaxID=282301 RepID=A0A1I8J3Z5_9PLAT|nr:hypothetical protein BOX15_Mlig004979g2 [Macrostomum lignano]
MSQQQDVKKDLCQQLMTLYEMRLRTFVKWPFSAPSRCTAERMARAGFYRIATPECPDAVRCFYCEKELDGWDANDDPVGEMRRHAPHCRYQDLPNAYDDMSVEEVLSSEAERHIQALERSHSAWQARVDSASQELLREIDRQIERIQGK